MAREDGLDGEVVSCSSPSELESVERFMGNEYTKQSKTLRMESV